MPLNAQAYLHSGNWIQRFLLLIGGVFKSSADDTHARVDLTSNVEKFLDAQISLIVIFTTH